MLATPSNESRGSHWSQPQTSIDPVIMAAATVLRLQTIVSREIAPSESAVLTIGSLQAGTKENIISPWFAPVIHPTLETGLRAMVAAAAAWLGVEAREA